MRNTRAQATGDQRPSSWCYWNFADLQHPNVKVFSSSHISCLKLEGSSQASVKTNFPTERMVLMNYFSWTHLSSKARTFMFPMAASTNSFPTLTHFRAPVKLASFCKGLHWCDNRMTNPLHRGDEEDIAEMCFSILTCNQTRYQGSTDGQAEGTDANCGPINRTEKQSKSFTFNSCWIEH